MQQVNTPKFSVFFFYSFFFWKPVSATEFKKINKKLGDINSLIASYKVQFWGGKKTDMFSELHNLTILS